MPEAKQRHPLRRQIVGAEALAAALERGEAVRIVLRRESALSDPGRAALERARDAGASSRAISQTQLARLCGSSEAPELLAMIGPDPRLSLEEMLEGDGAAWLLVGTAFPGNAGFVIRTAELSGADGVVLDAPFDHAQRRDARRAAMRADRYLPVHYADAAPTIELARAAGRRIVALEDCGAVAPWEADLLPPTLFVLGGERHGIPRTLIDTADLVLRIPMAGFMPSYNLQAAMAAVASERLRQQETGN